MKNIWRFELASFFITYYKNTVFSVVLKYFWGTLKNAWKEKTFVWCQKMWHNQKKVWLKKNLLLDVFHCLFENIFCKFLIFDSLMLMPRPDFQIARDQEILKNSFNRLPHLVSSVQFKSFYCLSTYLLRTHTGTTLHFIVTIPQRDNLIINKII